MNESAKAKAGAPDRSAFWMPFTANRPFKSAPRTGKVLKETD